MTETLVCVRETLADPKHWIKGQFARTSRGYQTDPTGPDAVKFCLLGAVRRCAGFAVFGDQNHNRQYWLTMQALERVAPTHFLADYNDMPETTHEDILALIDKAIQVSEAA